MLYVTDAGKKHQAKYVYFIQRIYMYKYNFVEYLGISMLFLKKTKLIKAASSNVRALAPGLTATRWP